MTQTVFLGKYCLSKVPVFFFFASDCIPSHVEASDFIPWLFHTTVIHTTFNCSDTNEGGLCIFNFSRSVKLYAESSVLQQYKSTIHIIFQNALVFLITDYQSRY